MRKSICLGHLYCHVSATEALFHGQDGNREIKRLGLGPEWKEVAKHNYRLVDVIERGSTSIVVKASCMETGKYVAIKRVHKVSESKYSILKVLREVNIQALLQRQEEALKLPPLFAGMVDAFAPSSELEA